MITTLIAQSVAVPEVSSRSRVRIRGAHQQLLYDCVGALENKVNGRRAL